MRQQEVGTARLQKLRTGVGIFAAGALLFCGCSAADLTFTSLDYRSIEPAVPQVFRFGPQECHWGFDESEDFYLGLRFDNLALSEVFKQRMRISLRIRDCSPSVSGNYRLAGGDLLGVLFTSIRQYRFRSIVGAVAINAHEDGRLEGAIRVRLMLVSEQLFGGWARPRPFHLVGTFSARRNDRSVRDIEAECDAGPWRRGQTASRASSRPSTKTGKRLKIEQR